MSQENVERVREAFAAFNRGEYHTAIGLFHPDAEWIPYLGALESAIYRGREALLEIWNDINQSFGGTFRMEPLEVIDCGDRVVVLVEAHGTGTSSGAELRQRWAQLASIQDGQIVRVEPFPSRDAALEAAGQSGQAAQ